jgi:hypothetical protein
MMSVLGARAQCSGEIWCSVLALMLGKIEVLSARFFKVLEHRTYRALSHNFSGIEVFVQKCLYF